jgi:hypothetical protein
MSESGPWYHTFNDIFWVTIAGLVVGALGKMAWTRISCCGLEIEREFPLEPIEENNTENGSTTGMGSVSPPPPRLGGLQMPKMLRNISKSPAKIIRKKANIKRKIPNVLGDKDNNRNNNIEDNNTIENNNDKTIQINELDDLYISTNTSENDII